MISSTKATFVFVFDGKVISGTGYVNSYSMQFDRGSIDMCSLGDTIASRIPSPFFDIDVSIRAQEMTISEGERVSRKLVSDCSIEELIFAIQQKAKEK